MVERLRAGDDVDVAAGERGGARIGAHGGADAMPARQREGLGDVEAERLELDSRPRRHDARACRDVAEAGADIEQRRLRCQLAEHEAKLGENGTRAAEEEVRAFDVAERAAHELWIDEWIIEDLEAAAARRREKRGHVTARAAHSRRGSRVAAVRDARAPLRPRR